MRCLLVSLFSLSLAHLACGRSELDFPIRANVDCQTDDACPAGLTCMGGLCVMPDDNPSTGPGGGGGAGGTGGGWDSTEAPASGGAAGSPLSSEPSIGGSAPVPAGSPAVAGAIAGGPARAGAVAGIPASGGPIAGSSATRSSSVGQAGSGGSSVGGRLSVSVAGNTSTVGGSGGASRTSSSSSRPNGEITFRSGQAQGLMSGYVWVALGEKDMMTSPTCDTGQPITNAMPCTTQTRWSTRDSVCMSGSIPALPASPVQADYDKNWGMEVGVNAMEPPDGVGPAMSSFSAVTFTYSGIPKTGVRAFVHRKGDPDATTYCVDSIASGRTLSMTKFNTKCWGDATTVLLSIADLPNIDKIGLMVSSTSAAVTVNNFCLERIQFN